MAKYSDTGYVQWATYVGGNGNNSIKTIATETIVTNNTTFRNSAFGNGALENLTIGSENIALGYNAGNMLNQGSNNIYIGNEGDTYDNNTIRIGNLTHDKCQITSSDVINLNTKSLQFNGGNGSNGQVLSVSATGTPQWVTTETPTLLQIMNKGNTAGTTLNMNNNNITNVRGISGNTIFLTTDRLFVNGSSGSSGQVLSVSATGTPQWITTETPTLLQVMNKSNIAGTTLNMNNNNITNVNGISGTTIYLTTSTLFVNGNMNINSPITPLYIALPTRNQIGYSEQILTGGTYSFTTGNPAIGVTFAAGNAGTSPGTWLYEVRFSINVVAQINKFSLSTVSNAFSTLITSMSNATNTENYGSLIGVIPLTTNTPVYFLMTSGTIQTVRNISARVTRIA